MIPLDPPSQPRGRIGMHYTHLSEMHALRSTHSVRSPKERTERHGTLFGIPSGRFLYDPFYVNECNGIPGVYSTYFYLGIGISSIGL